MQQTLFDFEQKTLDDVINPDTYKGIYSFHKYWGKKPLESINYFIQQYTTESDIIIDPFLGSGFIVHEGLRMNRRVIGIDLNPFSIEHTQFLLDLPSPKEYISAIKNIEASIKEKTYSSYMLENNTIASHYLWEGDSIKQIWSKQENKRTRIEIEPTDFDRNLFNSYRNYNVRNIRDAHFFTNSRINSYTTMTLSDIFTDRALRNIDLIIDEIKKYSGALQRALYLTLTSSSGQMSSMVFAITNRGKTQNKKSEKIEVGSWVIGFWRPELHFEINVWNCFESRAKKLYNALQNTSREKYKIHSNLSQLFHSTAGCYLANNNCLDELNTIPDNSIKLVCTDPPHSDRIPYLELSEIWNSILNKNVSFEKEIIVSNAKERNKKKDNYINDMEKFIGEVNRILKTDGIFLLYFNARDKESWKFMKIIEKASDLEFCGAFPLEYSATSVVQDNRKGGMKNDYILLMKHKKSKVLNESEFSFIPGWIEKLTEITL
ncbi:MAG: DNA adenine methylase [Bacteroidales bacterium]|jgi:SAM-dependent methyltransferase|nr:DNA adenine methylase [Bacteroidales bacterium]